MTSSPLRPGASLEEELDYYKKQYEQLETDLADFQASSKELEEQLERDIENAEKNERKFKEQVETLRFEVEEWKTKHKQSKTESNNAQNALQKEITTLREANRTMQLQLRDTEVMNDDYERQARNTESSLEDMESKYNVAIERGVLLDEELKTGEQEREGLRIETQRLRDELSDLKVESEITLEKLRLADDTIERLRSRKPSPPAVESLRAKSPGSEASFGTSPTASTPPPKSDVASEAPTPPSPPLSDAAKPDPKTPSASRRRSLIPDNGTTPRAGVLSARIQNAHSRAISAASNATMSTSDARSFKAAATKARPVSRPSNLNNEGLPRSDSLYQIRSLRGRMQKIEERVHSARSKLPAPKGGTPKGSPRAGSAVGDNLPSSITMRRSMRRPPSNVGSFADGASDAGSETPLATRESQVLAETPDRRESKVKRLSYGIPRPTSVAADRPQSALDRPPSAAAANRPSSRTSLASGSVNGHANRPCSRTEARTPIGQFASTNGFSRSTTASRSNSSAGGNYATIHGTPRSHRPSASVSELRRLAESEDSSMPPSPSRRLTFDKTALPTPGGTLRRQSGTLSQFGRRPSTGPGLQDGMMKPPPMRRKNTDVGETY